MLALVGTYRGMRYIPRLLESVQEHVNGITSYVFIDDSADPEVSAELSQYGEVIQTHGRGYNAAMRAATTRGALEDAPVVWLEEDFYFTAPVNFDLMARALDTHPHWAQLVVQREPYYQTELDLGGIVGYNRKRGKNFKQVDGYWEHDAFFSGNPSVWRPEVLKLGWPDGASSESLMTKRLLAAGYKFALTIDTPCAHDGEHLGTGY